MTFAELRERLQAMPRKDALAVATAAGVPHSTLDKLRMGIGDTARASTVEKLAAAMRRSTRRKAQEAA